MTTSRCTRLSKIWLQRDALSLVISISVSEGREVSAGGWVGKDLLGDDFK